MKIPARIGLYAAGLAAVFAASAAVAGAVVPEQSVQSFTQSDHAEEPRSGHAEDPQSDHQQEAPGAGGTEDHTNEGATMVRGQSLEQDGYVLSEVSAPETVDARGQLSFTVTTRDGEPMTGFAVEHDKKLHLIVVRSDGTHFRHVHPTMDVDGRWSLPWMWEAAGTYRVYADFVPVGGDNLTLTRTVDVAGDLRPEAPAMVSTTSSVDGFDVALRGDLRAGTGSPLTAEVTRDGEPVTTLEPYLGAYGHLVALRAGDLAYLHVHPEGDEPSAGQLSGPEVTFDAEAPTAGQYLLYLDFKVDGRVHTATFVVDAALPAAGGETSTGHGTTDHGH